MVEYQFIILKAKIRGAIQRLPWGLSKLLIQAYRGARSLGKCIFYVIYLIPATVLRAFNLRAPDFLTVRREHRLSIINVEITTYCNLRCSGCCLTVGTKNGTWKYKHMDLERFRRLVNDLPPTSRFVPYGIGEPMMHPQIFEIIRIAVAAGKFAEISLTTNATTRKLEDYYRLFDIGLTSLCISVDTLDPDLIDKLRPGTDVELLRYRIKNLAARFPGRIETRTVVGRNNIHALSDLLQTLNELGYLTANFQAYDDVGNPEGCLTADENVMVQHQLMTAASSHPKLRIVTGNFVPSRQVCSMPWDSPFVTVDGFITPCCRIVDPKVKSFGNAFARPFSESWDSPESQAWREDFQLRSPSECLGCPMYVFRQKTQQDRIVNN